MGWLFPLLLSTILLTMFWRSGRFSRQALELAGAALLIALASYAWQGNPTMPGSVVQKSTR